MILGTCYFTDKSSAIRYYKPYMYGNAETAVAEKLAKGEIKIGSPPCRHDEVAFVREGRYLKRIG